METTFIHTPGPGSGHSRKWRLGFDTIQKLLAKKKSVVTINNKDNLCCARAIVMMRAYADQGHDGLDYKNLRKGYPIKERLAWALHQQTGVPEGPCGLKELQLFQDALPGYQIKVLAIHKPHHIIFCGPAAAKQILLLKVDHHFHGCNSFGGFLDHSYFCHDCNCGYDHEDQENHPCKGKWCWACESSNCPVTSRQSDL